MSAPEILNLKLQVKTGLTRLDQALLDHLRQAHPGISRSQLKALFEEKRIKLQGMARPPSWSLVPGSYEVQIEGLSSESGSNQAQPSTQGPFLPVVYEDSELLVLNKASGIPSLPHSPSETETAVGSALAHLPALSGIGRGGLEPGLLHRLDTGTSGLLAFAKTQEAFERLHDAWKAGKVQKIYRAWVAGDAERFQLPLPLDLTLAHHPESQKRMIVLMEGEKRKYRGKPLSTSTEILNCLEIRKVSGVTYSDLEIEIRSGVMHQIRVTVAHLGHPIAGDPIYNPKDKTTRRLLLHAWKLVFPAGLLISHRANPLEIEARLPLDFKP